MMTCCHMPFISFCDLRFASAMCIVWLYLRLSFFSRLLFRITLYEMVAMPWESSSENGDSIFLSLFNVLSYLS